MHRNPSLLVAASLVGVTTVAGVALMAPRSLAVTSDMKVAQASVTVSATCSMTANVTTEHNATLINGQYSGDNGSYTNGIGSTTINTICNDSGGYAIYAVGFTDNNAGNNKLVNNALSGHDIVTGTATSGDTSNWAMKVSADTTSALPPIIENDFKNTTTGESVFTSVPTSYTKVAHQTTTTSRATNSSSIITTYAAYISPTQPAGTYAGQVAYLLVHPNSNEQADDTFFAMQNVAKWGKTIKIGEEVTAIDSRDGKQYTVARLCMNASNPSACENGTLDEKNTYSRLWMTENLDLTIDNNTTYTHGDTDLGWADNNTGATWKPNVGTGTITNFASGNPANSLSGWTNTYTAPYQAEGNDGTNEIYVRKAIKYEGLDACVSDVVLKESMTQTNAVKDCKHYHVGNYYNWSAAVANNNTGSYTQDKYVMPNSICPAGWRLPNGLTTENSTTKMSEFNQLLKAYGVTGNENNLNGVDLSGGQNVGYATNAFNDKIIVSPLYFVRSGNLNDSTLYNFTSGGYYWSGTVNSSSGAYNLGFYSGNLYPANRNSRYDGRSVRCVAR